MNHYEFFNFLQQWRKYAKYPPASSWPREIAFDKATWEGLTRLHKYTATNNLEYESSFFVVDGQMVASEPFKGNESSVTANHSLQVKYVPGQAAGYYEKHIIIDDKVVRKDYLETKDAKEIDAGFMFNVHTHPVHNDFQGRKTYSFFSGVDINSLLLSPGLITGLITDEFWLAGKTDQALKTIGEVGQEMLERVTNQAFVDRNYLTNVVKTEMSKWGLVFYRAEFDRSLVRVL